MENCKDLPELTINAKEDQEEVFKLLKLIKPAWKKEQVNITILSGGYSCCMLRCSHGSGESVTVRVRNNLECLRDPVHETQILKVMSSQGIFPPLLAVFQNGFCYDYIPGRPLYMKGTPQFSLDEEQLRLIAHQMADIHAVVVPGFDYKKSTFFDFFVQLVSTGQPEFEGCPSAEELIQEIRVVEECVAGVRSPLVHIHGDSHPANMVWNQKQNKITFVDWELSQVAPRAYDLARFFNSFKYTAHYVNIPITTPSDMERKLCVHYLERWNAQSNKPSPAEDEIKQLLLELKYFSLVVNVMFLVFAFRFSDILAQFGKIESLWQYNLNAYLSTKEELLCMKTFGSPPCKTEHTK